MYSTILSQVQKWRNYFVWSGGYGGGAAFVVMGVAKLQPPFLFSMFLLHHRFHGQVVDVGDIVMTFSSKSKVGK